MKRTTPLKARMRPKPRKRADPAYLDFVRSQPCCACGKPPPSHPHHKHGERTGEPKGMGLKAPDSTAIPICPSDHHAWHSQGQVLAVGPDGGLDWLTRAETIALFEATRARLRKEWEAR